MPEWWSIIGPAGPVIGAILGASITALVAFRNKERRRVTFLVHRTENLSEGLSKHWPRISIMAGDQTVQNLMRGRVEVVNSGNTTIKDLAFQVYVHGEPTVCTSDVEAEALELRKSVEVMPAHSEDERLVDPYFDVRVPFLNRKERFEVVAFFDGRQTELVVSCRHEGTDVRIREPTAVYAETFASVFKEAAIQALVSGVRIGTR